MPISSASTISLLLSSTYGQSSAKSFGQFKDRCRPSVPKVVFFTFIIYKLVVRGKNQFSDVMQNYNPQLLLKHDDPDDLRSVVAL
jgi:hypothetical protein